MPDSSTSKTKSLPLKAYTVLEDNENTGDIFFARHAIVARRLGANEFNDGELGGLTCRRAHWADKYAKAGHVPFTAKFDYGWWIECTGCGATIREGADEEEDDDGDPVEPYDLVERGDCVFCRPACYDRWKADRAETKRIKEETIGEMTDMLLRLVPGAVLTGDSHVYVSYHEKPRRAQQCVIHFAFPGMLIGSASYRFDKAGEKPTVLVCRGDLYAFSHWRSLGYPPHLMDADV